MNQKFPESRVDFYSSSKRSTFKENLSLIVEFVKYTWKAWRDDHFCVSEGGRNLFLKVFFKPPSDNYLLTVENIFILVFFILNVGYLDIVNSIMFMRFPICWFWSIKKRIEIINSFQVIRRSIVCDIFQRCKKVFSRNVLYALTTVILYTSLTWYYGWYYLQQQQS